MKAYGEYPPDYDQIDVDFERAEVRRARLTHTCSVCCQPIRPGQRYLRVFAIVEGEPQTQLSHGLVIGECAGPDW